MKCIMHSKIDTIRIKLEYKWVVCLMLVKYHLSYDKFLVSTNKHEEIFSSQTW